VLRCVYFVGSLETGGGGGDVSIKSVQMEISLFFLHIYLNFTNLIYQSVTINVKCNNLVIHLVVEANDSMVEPYFI